MIILFVPLDTSTKVAIILWQLATDIICPAYAFVAAICPVSAGWRMTGGEGIGEWGMKPVCTVQPQWTHSMCAPLR